MDSKSLNAFERPRIVYDLEAIAKEIDISYESACASDLIFYHTLQSYLDYYDVAWFGCTRFQWYEICFLTATQATQARKRLAKQGYIKYQSYHRFGHNTYGEHLTMHSTHEKPPFPGEDNFFILEKVPTRHAFNIGY